MKHFLDIHLPHLQLAMIIIMTIYNLPLQINMSRDKNNEYAQCWYVRT